MSEAELAQLLALLDEALSAPRAEDGSQRARTADGRLELRVGRPAREGWVAIETPAGTLRCLDYELEVVAAAGRARLRAGGEAER